jgi:DNA transformation protein and related proteins
MKARPVDDFVVFVTERMAVLGEVRAKKMFGGHGIYVDEIFCALIANDALWFKVDAVNRPDYEARGLPAFRPFDDQTMVMSYCLVPDEVLERDAAMEQWGRRAIEAGVRARGKAPPKKRKAAGVLRAK